MQFSHHSRSASRCHARNAPGGCNIEAGAAAPELIERLTADLKAALQKPDVLQLIRDLGTEPEFLPPAEFAARSNTEFARWGKIMRDNNIKAD